MAWAWQGIKFKTAITLTVGVLAIVALYDGLQGYLVRSDVKDVVGAQQLALLGPIAENIDNRLALNQQALVAVADGIPAELADKPASIIALLKSNRALFAMFDNVTLIGVDGHLVATLPYREVTGRYIGERAYFKRTLQTAQSVISEPVVALPLGEPAVIITAPVFDRGHHVAAMLTGVLQLMRPNFLGQVATARVGRGGRISIFTLDRKIMLGWDRAHTMIDGPPPGKTAHFDRAMREADGWSEELSFKGDEKAIFTFKRLGKVPWVIELFTPSREAFAPFEAAHRRAIAMGACMCLLLPALIWLGVSRLLAPLTALRDGVQALRHDPASTLPACGAGKDEIGDLTAEFNALLSERQAASDELATAQTRLRMVADNMPAQIGYVDSEQRYRFVNRTFLQWSGRRESEYIGSTMAQMVGEARYAVLEPHIQRALAGERVTFQHERRDIDPPKIVEANYIPDLLPDGRVNGVFVMVSDITSLKRVESMAGESRAALAAMIDSARDAIITTDQAQRVVIFNHAAEAMFGYAAAEIVGQPLDRLIPPRSRAAFREHVECVSVDSEAALQMNAAEQLVDVMRSDGVEFPVEASISRVERQGGTEYTFIMRDVTERLKAAAQTQATATFLRQMVENMPMGVSVMDMDLNYLAFNERFLDLLDLPREGFAPGDPMEKFLRYNVARGDYGPGDPEVLLQERLALARRNEPQKLERCFLSGKAVEIRRVPVPGLGFVSVYTDVTERREEARRLNEARENAESTARAKSEFLATMSHEVRTPMNGVLGIAQLLLDTPLDAEQRDYVDTILRSGQSLMEILNDILDLSKIEAGKLELESRAYDPVLTIKDVLALYAPRASAKGLYLVLDVAPDLPRDVLGDGGRLRQVLSNLIGNSIKFTHGGQVRVTAQVLKSGETGFELGFAVVDTGIGMTADEQARLFQPFTQADSSTTRRFGGTGLGLAICKHLVEMMGGAFTVESAPGEGTTFSFSVHGEHAAPGSSLANSGPWQGLQRFSGRVLVVEDNLVNLKVARATLKGFGVEVVVAENGKLALDAARCGQFDLVFMDMHMPVMDGLAATRAIRAAEAAGELAGHLPIVAMTANVMQDAVVACREAGMDDFLPKPYARRQLAEVLARWLTQIEQSAASAAAPAAAPAPAPAPAAAAAPAPAARPSGAAINAARFAQLAGTMGGELMTLIDDFIDGTLGMFEALQMPSARDDAGAIVRHAHTLKSNAELIGALRLGAMAREWEAISKLGRLDQLDQTLDALREEFAQVRAALRDPQTINGASTHA